MHLVLSLQYTSLGLHSSVSVKCIIFTARKRSLGQGNIFTPVCHSVHGGGMRGCSWGACVVALGGMRGFIWGVCMVLFGGACIVLFGGACMVLFGGACIVFSVFSDTMRYGQ